MILVICSNNLLTTKSTLDNEIKLRQYNHNSLNRQSNVSFILDNFIHCTINITVNNTKYQDLLDLFNKYIKLTNFKMCFYNNNSPVYQITPYSDMEVVNLYF